MEAIEKSPAASLATQAQSRPILDLISQTFPPFDHRASIVTPFENENQRDAKFQEELSAMLLSLMLEFHAWSTARPSLENDKNADELEQEINTLLETEKEQGRSSALQFLIERTRQHLSEFVERIKIALAALTGLVP